MAPTVNLVMTWILFLALFPMAFFWLRRTWRIVFKRDFSEVALKRGLPSPNAEKYAPVEALINLATGAITVVVIAGVVAGLMHYDTWTAIAGSTIWCKFFASFIVSRHAHGGAGAKKNHVAAEG